jgi:hypothetical protein
MKPTWSLMAAALCSVWAGALVRTDAEPKFNFLPYPTASLINYSSDSSPWVLGANDNLFTLNNAVTNRLWPQFRTDKPMSGSACRRSQPAYVPPGVYRSTPYSCLILVPDPQDYAKSLHQPRRAGMEEMPVIKPGLKLIPYPPDKK